MIQLESFLCEALKADVEQKRAKALDVLETKLPFERYNLNRLISDGYARGSRADIINLRIKPSKFEGCYDISYSDLVNHVRSSATITTNNIGSIILVKSDPDKQRDRPVYVGNGAVQVVRALNACCAREAIDYMFQHPGKYAIRSTVRNYCTSIARQEIQDAFDIVSL